MEERIIDEEIGRKIKVKKLADGETDVVDDLAEEGEVDEEAGAEEEMTFELPDLEEDDEDLACLSPEEAQELRKKKAAEAAVRRQEYDKIVAAGNAFLAEGSYHSAELQFEKALNLDDEAMEASVGYWRAKTHDFDHPDVLMDEYVEPGYENLEFDLGYRAVDAIKAEYKEKFARRYQELEAEEAPLREKVEAAQQRRREILKPRRRKSMIAFILSLLPFLGALAATIVFLLKNFTVRDNGYILPTVIAGGVTLVAFIVFGVFTNRFINACRICRANERLSATDDGTRLLEIADYKELYSHFI